MNPKKFQPIKIPNQRAFDVDLFEIEKTIFYLRMNEVISSLTIHQEIRTPTFKTDNLDGKNQLEGEYQPILPKYFKKSRRIKPSNRNQSSSLNDTRQKTNE